MPEEYTYLFNAVTDAIARLEELRRFLIAAQQHTEQIFMERTE